MSQYKKEIKVKVPDEALRGTYSNSVAIRHSRGEFVMDFMTVYPPQGIVGARIIVSPNHAKNLIKALQQNVDMYEKKFGVIPEDPLMEVPPENVN